MIQAGAAKKLLSCLISPLSSDHKVRICFTPAHFHVHHISKIHPREMYFALKNALRPKNCTSPYKCTLPFLCCYLNSSPQPAWRGSPPWPWTSPPVPPRCCRPQHLLWNPDWPVILNPSWIRCASPPVLSLWWFTWHETVSCSDNSLVALMVVESNLIFFSPPPCRALGEVLLGAAPMRAMPCWQLTC